MRYLLGALVLAAGCGPQAVPTDAPAADTAFSFPWVACGGCAPRCDGLTFEVSCTGASGVDCEGCIPLCGVPSSFSEDASAIDRVECTDTTSPPVAGRCGEDVGRFDRGLCYRPR